VNGNFTLIDGAFIEQASKANDVLRFGLGKNLASACLFSSTGRISQAIPVKLCVQVQYFFLSSEFYGVRKQNFLGG
jgi:hypothetical protein